MINKIFNCIIDSITNKISLTGIVRKNERMPMARLAIQEKWRVNLLPESVNHILSANFSGKEIFCNRVQLYLICTFLQISIAHSNETLPS